MHLKASNLQREDNPVAGKTPFRFSECSCKEPRDRLMEAQWPALLSRQMRAVLSRGYNPAESADAAILMATRSSAF